MNILVVDDEENIREIMVDELTGHGYKVITASGGDEAFEIIKASPISVVISDVKMPNGDGVKLLENINKMHKNRPLVILVSGMADLNSKDLIERGALNLISKPINFEDLLFQLSEIFKKQKK